MSEDMSEKVIEFAEKGLELSTKKLAKAAKSWGPFGDINHTRSVWKARVQRAKGDKDVTAEGYGRSTDPLPKPFSRDKVTS